MDAMQAPQARSLTLDEPGMGVNADDPAAYMDLVSKGLIGAAGRGCNAVQDDVAMRAATRTSLGTTAV
ncbi:hypothetical protein ACIQWZ_18890 [Streptomyces sp. NPDC098077]|uniref:hypothetical protein n=1 Tax=Streptomyces sp. NPDC098077 TaxID=3366093 RepID=UPI0037F63F49